MTIDKLWPDFTPDDAMDMIRKVGGRKRRFGGSGVETEKKGGKEVGEKGGRGGLGG